MSLLVLKAYFNLIKFDMHLAKDDFRAIHEEVRLLPVRPITPPAEIIENVCSAIDTAIIWYWKEIRCLQRSAATACLLRQYGVPAELVIGVQPLPFKAHAWVEVDRHVVNDKPYTSEMYMPLERC